VSKPESSDGTGVGATSAPSQATRTAVGVLLASCAIDIVEIAALRGRAAELERIASQRGLALPVLGRVVGQRGVARQEVERVAVSVRPARWLLLTSPGAPGEAASSWQAACAGAGVAVDLSSALSAFHLAGPASVEVLARGCRLDLDADAFPLHTATATIMAQVSVVLARVASGMLLLTPATTARHFHEWLTAAARPFGLESQSDMPVALPGGESVP
jgi:heterotetrameric sarcosine oxidase gamma subunit